MPGRLEILAMRALASKYAKEWLKIQDFFFAQTMGLPYSRVHRFQIDKIHTAGRSLFYFVLYFENQLANFPLVQSPSR